MNEKIKTINSDLNIKIQQTGENCGRHVRKLEVNVEGG